MSKLLPPGQIEHDEFVAMPPIRWDYPNISKSAWKLKIYGQVEKELEFNWEQFNELEQKQYTLDFHCVTRWSKFGQAFTGVNFKTIVNLVKPNSKAKFVIFEGYDGYSTNLSLEELLSWDDVIVATQMDGKDIPIQLGGPVRVVVPKLYGWKSSKFLCAIKFSEVDIPGYWETRGYHNHGDPLLEERYS